MMRFLASAVALSVPALALKVNRVTPIQEGIKNLTVEGTSLVNQTPAKATVRHERNADGVSSLLVPHSSGPEPKPEPTSRLAPGQVPKSSRDLFRDDENCRNWGENQNGPSFLEMQNGANDGQCPGAPERKRKRSRALMEGSTDEDRRNLGPDMEDEHQVKMLKMRANEVYNGIMNGGFLELGRAEVQPAGEDVTPEPVGNPDAAEQNPALKTPEKPVNTGNINHNNQGQALGNPRDLIGAFERAAFDDVNINFLEMNGNNAAQNGQQQPNAAQQQQQQQQQQPNDPWGEENSPAPPVKAGNEGGNITYAPKKQEGRNPPANRSEPKRLFP
jgi:hypothetical protein